MPLIAPHLLPGGWRHATAGQHELACSWPDDCLVQWGDSGLVLPAGSPSYLTAFFEAFPTDPGTFIRGEGKTIGEAELAAFSKLERFRTCPDHEFERRRHRNGAGFCKHCGLFKAAAFDPLETCVICGTPTFFTYGVDSEGVSHWYCETHKASRCRTTHPSPLDKLMADLEDELPQ